MSGSPPRVTLTFWRLIFPSATAHRRAANSATWESRRGPCFRVWMEPVRNCESATSKRDKEACQDEPTTVAEVAYAAPTASVDRHRRRERRASGHRRLLRALRAGAHQRDAGDPRR